MDSGITKDRLQQEVHHAMYFDADDLKDFDDMHEGQGEGQGQDGGMMVAPRQGERVKQCHEVGDSRAKGKAGDESSKHGRIKSPSAGAASSKSPLRNISTPKSPSSLHVSTSTSPTRATNSTSTPHVNSKSVLTRREKMVARIGQPKTLAALALELADKEGMCRQRHVEILQLERIVSSQSMMIQRMCEEMEVS